ncbi:hypothetical protein, partial [Petrachloros mirabilis]
AHYSAHHDMTQRKRQSSSYSPRVTIDCMLANVSRQLEADGCVLELSDANCKLATPDHLIPGDFVRVRLWLDSEGSFIDIRLAEVTKIHHHWITVEVIQMSAHDRMRLKRFVDVRAAMHQKEPAKIDRLLIRA